MSTDENLVARNQETAEANGLAAAHTRGRNLLLLRLIHLHLPPYPSHAGTRRRFLSLSRSDAHRNTTMRKTLDDCYIRRPEALASGRIPQRKQPVYSVGFRRSFFRSMSRRSARSRLTRGCCFELDSSNRENRAAIAQLGLFHRRFAVVPCDLSIFSHAFTSSIAAIVNCAFNFAISLYRTTWN